MFLNAQRMASFVYIKPINFDTFTSLDFLESDTATTLAERACSEFAHWGTAGQLTLYLVAQGGDREPSDDAIRRVRSDGRRLGAAESLKSAGISSGAWLVAAPACLPKQITLIVSSSSEGATSSKLLQLTITSQEHLKEVMRRHGGGALLLEGSEALHTVECVEDLTSGGTYSFLGGQQESTRKHTLWTQMAEKVLKEASTVAVRDACERSMGKLEMCISATLKSKAGLEKEFDGLLISPTTAIAVEAKHAAVLRHVLEVLKKAAFLQALADENSNERLQGITTVIPVLASNRISDLCELCGIGTVKPNGSGCTYTPPSRLWTPQLSQRSLHTFTGRRLFHTFPGQRTLVRALRVLLL